MTIITVKTGGIAADAVTDAKIADDAVNSEHYTDGSIDTAHIADNQVTLAKMAGGTDGNIISFDASGDPVAIATGSDGQVLTSTGAGSPPAFEALPAGGITEADQWRISANQTGKTSNFVFASNWERNDTNFDKIGTGMSQSSGIFTFPSTGIYLVSFAAMVSGNGSAYILARIKVSSNSGTDFTTRTEAYTHTSANANYQNVSCDIMLDVTNASTYRVRFEGESENAITYNGNSTFNATWSNFIRLGNT